jgi:anthranilate synthase component 2
MIYLIDNYDSFTYNIVHYLADIGVDVVVVKNDAITVAAMMRQDISHIIISPGAGTPEQAGISLELVHALAGKVPILGVCLGHEVIGQAFGGTIIRAKKLMHGKVSAIYHNGQGVFAGLPVPFNATRYHALVVDRTSLARELEVTAWTQEEDGAFGEIMGLRHRQWAVEGVQFHPEAILSECGHDLLRNFLGAAVRT